MVELMVVWKAETKERNWVCNSAQKKASRKVKRLDQLKESTQVLQLVHEKEAKMD